MRKLLLIGALVGVLAVPAAAGAHTLNLDRAKRETGQIGRALVQDPSTPFVGYEIVSCERWRNSPHQASCVMRLQAQDGTLCTVRVLHKFRSPRSRGVVSRAGNAYCG